MEEEVQEKTTEAAAAETPATEAPAKGKSIIDPKYRGKYKTPDWLASLIATACAATVTRKVKEGDKEIEKEFADGVDIDKLFALATENGLDVAKFQTQRDSHGFPGRFRMTVRNMLQTVIKQRHGLNVAGEWIPAPTDWLHSKSAPVEPTHSHDGTRIVVAKPAPMEPESKLIKAADKPAEAATDEKKVSEVLKEKKAKK